MNIDIQFEESNQSIDVDFGEIQIIGGSVVDATIEPLNVTENGTYTAQGDVDGYSPVYVNVPIPDGYIQPQGTIEITENGEYGVTEYANARVNIEEAKEEQEKTIDITENGTTEVTPDDGKVLSKVTVNVDVEKGIAPSGTLEITENGEYDVTEYASANVNVESGGSDVIDVIEQKAINGSYEYYNENLTVIPMRLFNYDSYLTKCSFPNVEEVGTDAFYYCTNLVEINFPKLKRTNQQSFGRIAIKNVVLPLSTNAGNDLFNYCEKLEKVDLPSVEKINPYVFNRNGSLKTVILRKTTLVTLSNTNAFNYCTHYLDTKDGYVYVPRALISSYQTATNWTKLYASHENMFRALEDYTIDGTITGELDESKI